MTDLIKRLRLQSEHIPVRTLFDHAADRIEELVKERDEYKAAAAIWQEDFIQENQRLYVATVKLAIAVEGLGKIANYTHIGEGGQGVTQNAEARIARATLAELEKTK